MRELKVSDNCLGYWEDEHFEVLTNFYFEPLWQVQTGKKSGYVANVYIQGESNPRYVIVSGKVLPCVVPYNRACSKKIDSLLQDMLLFQRRGAESPNIYCRSKQNGGRRTIIQEGV